MIGWEVLALVALPVAAAPSYSVAGGARTELRLRTPGDIHTDGTTGARAADAELALNGRFITTFRRIALGIGYLPKLTLSDFTAEPVREILHGAEASLTWNGPRAALTLRQSFSYGERNFSALSGPRIDPRTGDVSTQAALEGSVVYLSSDTQLSSALVLSRRSRLTLTTGYTLAGGANEESREQLPLTSGPRGAVSWDYAQTRFDTLVTQVDGTVQRVDVGGDTASKSVILIGLSQAWRRRWARATTGEIALGLDFSSVSPSEQSSISPAGLASLSHRLNSGPSHATLDLLASVGADNVVDQLTGDVDTRGQATARAIWTLVPVAVHAQVTRVQSLRQSESSLELIAAELGSRVALARPLALDLGVRMVHQSLEEESAAPETLASAGLNWVVFVGLELRLAPVPL